MFYKTAVYSFVVQHMKYTVLQSVLYYVNNKFIKEGSYYGVIMGPYWWYHCTKYLKTICISVLTGFMVAIL